MVVSRDMTDQLARAGTSVGANIHEAQYAQSKKDFIAKLEIALKESNETSYWLKPKELTSLHTNMPRNCAAIFADC